MGVPSSRAFAWAAAAAVEAMASVKSIITGLLG
jgi:hypothetical protein